MYIWIGCQLPEDFEASIRRAALDANREIGANTAAFSLPQHISLKISFDTGDRAVTILEYLKDLLSGQHQFYVNPQGIAQNGSILWVTFRENKTLSRLHRLLDGAVEQEFGIPQHPFDRDFQFHSTLFLDNPNKISRLLAALREYPLPERLAVDGILLGLSDTGAAGTYRVVHRIGLE